MAETVVGLVLQNLGSLIQNEFVALWGVEEELQKLASTLSTIQYVLEDAEGRQFSNKVLGNWLAKLREVAYDADDIVDECTTTQIQQSDASGICSKQVCKILPSPLCYNHMKFRIKTAHRIKIVIDKLDVIAAERSKFHLREGNQDIGLESEQRTPTDSFVIESEVYGRGEDKEKMVELLLACASSQENVLVIPIEGMGGVGKTTLAQLIYNDRRVEENFELRIWVCVSEDFELKRLITAIIESASGNKSDAMDLDPLQNRLRETLKGKKFLLVLDDVWNEDEEKWGRLKQLLTCGGKGSAVIVTTRIKKIAAIMGTISSGHHLAGLSMDDCWSLFRRRAFGDWIREEEHPNLVEIGKEIVKKCGGVPLAARTLGSLLRFKSEEREWSLVKESEIWGIPENENTILPALRLSYTHLPYHLRQCFAYCSIFPKDYEMEKEELIHLWMANGLVQPRARTELEDIGHEIFNELLWRSFFQDIQKDDSGNITKCKMHDLMNDLAQSISGDECYSVEGDLIENVCRRTKHLFCSLGHLLSTNSTLPKSLFKVRRLHTLILKDAWNVTKFPRQISKLQYLRVLYISGIHISKLPSWIGSLKHLRYLNFSESDIETLPESISNLLNLQILKLSKCSNLLKLPESISNLVNLQTLDLNHCPKFCELPKELGKMINLKHLDIFGTCLTHMPLNMGELRCLLTLTLFVVGEREGSQITELQHLRNLKGELSIKNLSSVTHARDARDANLICKQNIRALKLAWLPNGCNDMQGLVEEEVLEALQPHPNLKELNIDGNAGISFPRWFQASSLPSLVKLELLNCGRCEKLPPLGQLPLLKFLKLQGLHAVKCITDEFYGSCTREGFPSLETLCLEDMQMLEVWQGVNGRRHFPRLSELTVTRCENLMTLPHFPSISSLSISGYDKRWSLPEGLLKNFTHLEHLCIGISKNLKTLGRELDNLVALKSLQISDCWWLEALPQGLRNLKSLNILHIQKCSTLVSLREGIHGLSSLTHLYISECLCLSSLSGLQSLTSLEVLTIKTCSSLTSLSEGIQHLTSLRCLTVRKCQDLASLPNGMQHVTSIQHLTLEGGPRMDDFPEWIGKLTSLQYLEIGPFGYLPCLPEWLQGLTWLKSLTIVGCGEELVRRCEKGRGEDWHKIAGIPDVNVFLGRVRVRRRTSIFNCCGDSFQYH